MAGSRRSRREMPSWRRHLGWLIPVLLLIAGIIVMLYPIIATLNNNSRHAAFAAKYNSQVQQADKGMLERRFAEAQAYSHSILGFPILDPYLTRVKDGNPDDQYQRYLAELNDFDTMARVTVPRLGIDLPVRHGTLESSLGQGAGHLYGTSLPVGGMKTHAVITSHTGYASATLFDHLHKAVVGDIIEIDVYGHTLYYEVDQIKTVEPSEVSDLRPVEGEDLITLFTCTPYGINSHRLLVRAHRVDGQVAATVTHGQHTRPVLERWMLKLLVGAAFALVLLVVIVVREWRRFHRPRAPRRAQPDVKHEGDAESSKPLP